MAPSKKNPGPPDPNPIRTLTDRIAALGLICSGTLLERTKTCGKPNCRCATDPQARHGPYHEWTWRQGGKLRHRIVHPAKVEALRDAIHNYRTAQDLLERWERLSASIIFAGPNPKSQPSKKINWPQTPSRCAE